MSPTLLWAGLGNMGRGMCKNIVEKGKLSGPLLIYNRTTKRATDLQAKLPAGKTEVVESLADGVSRADLIFSCLSNDEAVLEFYGNALTGNASGKVFIECSTVHPDTTESVAKSVQDKGGEFVAVPVFGAAPAAEAGQLIAVLAGPKASVDKAKPWFKGVMARAEIDFSDQPYGKASTLKVIGNTFIMNVVEQLAETYTLAEKIGMGTEPVKQLVDTLFGGPYSGYTARMLSGGYHKGAEPLFASDIAQKDARHAKNLAASVGVTMANTNHAYSQLDKVREHMGSRGDIAGLYGAARQDAGLKFEN